jgi:hypothetical protein
MRVRNLAVRSWDQLCLALKSEVINSPKHILQKIDFRIAVSDALMTLLFFNDNFSSASSMHYIMYRFKTLFFLSALQLNIHFLQVRKLDGTTFVQDRQICIIDGY